MLTRRSLQGDAEDLPFETDSKDRYVSAGSIEYWPEPQRGICEAYRVIKPGGLACVIGPVYPTFWLSRFFADAWMLFPTEKEYIDWCACLPLTSNFVNHSGVDGWMDGWMDGKEERERGRNTK